MCISTDGHHLCFIKVFPSHPLLTRWHYSPTKQSTFSQFQQINFTQTSHSKWKKSFQRQPKREGTNVAKIVNIKSNCFLLLWIFVNKMASEREHYAPRVLSPPSHPLLYENTSTTRSSEDIIELTLAQSFIPQKYINWGYLHNWRNELLVIRE